MNPLWLLLVLTASVTIPLGLLARLARIYPRPRLVWLALVPGVVALGLIAVPAVVWAVVAIDAILVLGAVVDLFSLPRRTTFRVVRETVRVASVRKPHPVTLIVSNHSQRDYSLALRDGVPPELFAEPDEFALPLAAHQRAVLHYVLRPGRRGAFRLEQTHLRVLSRWTLWQRLLPVRVETALHVYPDLRQLSQYALLARTNRLSLMGVRRVRRVGQDHDFERLRDYNLDDNYKHIDWRSTAKRNRLTVKDFQSSQSQRIVFLLDCGRMMTNQAAGLSLLDHAFNAMLMLSYVALRQGDSVGLICFSDEIHSFVPPQGSMRHMNRLLHACFDRFPRLVESRYDLAFRYLAAHCRRRSLVVLISNVIDEVNAAAMDRYLSNLVGRHLPLGVLLRDRALFDPADVELPAGDAFWNAAAASDILTWRRQVLNDLQCQGVLALDVFPEDLTAPLVNQYLQIKARHLL